MSSPLDRLKNLFKLEFDFETSDVTKKIVPAKMMVDKETGVERFTPEAFPSKVQQLFDWWITTNQIAVQDYKHITDLYDDCDQMYFNNPNVSRAIEMTADEVLQGGSGVELIKIEGKGKQKKFLKEFHKNINLNQYLRPIAVDLIQYGNGLWVYSFNDKGIEEIIPADIRQLKERLEFTPYEVEQEKNKNLNFQRYLTASSRIQTLLDMVKNKDNISSYFKRYLFGFRVGDIYLPPWRIAHFKNTTTKSPLAPFGIPFFVHSIAPCKQYESAMTMQMTSRGANFPRDVYKLTFPENLSPTEKLAKAQDFSMKLQNSGINAVPKEVLGVGEVIITIDGLYEYTQETPNMDLGAVGDLELLRNDVIASLFIPRNLIDSNDSGFGDSGVSLAEKFKVYARLVFRAQTLILEQIAQMDKIHMLYSGEFDPDDIDFTLSMPYPESLTSSDVVTAQKDILDLIDNIVTTLQDKLLDGDTLPDEVLKDIFYKFLPYDSITMEEWFKAIKKAKKEKEKEMMTEPGLEGGPEGTDSSSQFDMGSAGTDIDAELANSGFVAPPEEGAEGEEGEENILNPEVDISEEDDTEELKDSYKRSIDKIRLSEKRGRHKWGRLLEKHGKRKLKEMVDEEIFVHKQESFTEGLIEGRHFYSSRIDDKLFNIKMLHEIDVVRFKRLKESGSSFEANSEFLSLQEEYRYNDSESVTEEKVQTENLEQN